MFVFCPKATQLSPGPVPGHDPENHKGIPMLPLLTHSPLNSSFDASNHRLRLEVHQAVELHHCNSLLEERPQMPSDPDVFSPFSPSLWNKAVMNAPLLSQNGTKYS